MTHAQPPARYINTPAELQDAVGHRIAWETAVTPYHHTGKLVKLLGKNMTVEEDGETAYLWLPNIYNLRHANSQDGQTT